MSLKPLKVSDQKKLVETMRRKKKEIEVRHQLPPYTVIFSEGVKTEPYYIRGLTKQVNQKYAQFTSRDRIEVIGTGRNTKSLLDYARKRVQKEFPECKIVWLMYDKDDFPFDDFDNTQFSAEEKLSEQEYHVAWSNECIELWFVLHFQQLFTHIGREQYRTILKQYFPYEKNLETVYDTLKDKTQDALSHSQALYDSYAVGTPPSRMAPATRVHELVQFLQEYL